MLLDKEQLITLDTKLPVPSDLLFAVLLGLLHRGEHTHDRETEQPSRVRLFHQDVYRIHFAPQSSLELGRAAIPASLSTLAKAMA